VGGAVGRRQFGAQDHTHIADKVAVEHPAQHLEHGLRADVGQEAEPAAVDADERDGRTGHQRSRMQHRAVTADGDDQVAALAQFRGLDRVHRLEIAKRTVLLHQDLDAPSRQESRQICAGFRDGRVHRARYHAHIVESASHSWGFSILSALIQSLDTDSDPLLACTLAVSR
jgi:hypothetical protein